jgi:superfamily II DNA/RNA helicase
LAEQIYGEIDKFISPSKNSFLLSKPQYQDTSPNQVSNSTTFRTPKMVSVIGGVSMQTQIETILRKGVDIIVATPGRLIDLMEKGIITTDRISYLVFDEADRMLSMNMEEQLRKVY